MQAVVTEISPIARPRRAWLVPDTPKTRSGKIMRRVLASISSGQDAGDISTLCESPRWSTNCARWQRRSDMTSASDTFR